MELIDDSRYLEPPDLPCDCERCEDCHQHHIINQEFPIECETCVDEKCKLCNGTGWYIVEPEGDIECQKCNGQGRVK